MEAYCSCIWVSELDIPSPRGSGDGVASAGAVDIARGVGKGFGEILVILPAHSLR